MPINTLYQDIDGCLVDAKKIPYEGVRDRYEIWQGMYETRIAWSNTGGAYVKRLLQKYDLLDFFMKEMEVWLPKEKKWIKAMVPLCFDKPDMIIDNDPDSIFRGAALINLSTAEDWFKDEDAIFQGSRDHVKKYL